MKNRVRKFISLALCAVVLFAAAGTSVFALTGEGKEGVVVVLRRQQAIPQLERFGGQARYAAVCEG